MGYFVISERIVLLSSLSNVNKNNIYQGSNYISKFTIIPI